MNSCHEFGVSKLLKFLFPHLVWDLPDSEKVVYLTFDDGPTRGITNKVLSILDTYQARATFFCLGRRIDENPELTGEIRLSGHSIGSHGYDHLNGFRTPVPVYVDNAKKGIISSRSDMFRPPYGKITPWQIAKIRPIAKIVLWSVLSRDYDKRVSGPACLKFVIHNIYPGAIIVFHDTEKAAENLLYVLPVLLDYLARNNYKTNPIVTDHCSTSNN